jgi:hypothetical protein
MVYSISDCLIFLLFFSNYVYDMHFYNFTLICCCLLELPIADALPDNGKELAINVALKYLLSLGVLV